MTRLTLIRHGETEWNLEKRLMGQSDSPLSAWGERQVDLVARRLSDIGFDVLYSSDLGRAAATAAAISSACGAPVVYRRDLRERALGVFQGLNWEEAVASFPRESELFHSDPDFCVPEGESRRDFSLRALGFLNFVSGSHEGQTVGAVTHGGFLDMAFRHVLGLDLMAPRSARLMNASLNVLDFENGRWILRTWGDISHLEEHQEVREQL
jgi:2,3-bisphosphoglycerate-dependent phosphoglycerate mutase